MKWVFMVLVVAAAAVGGAYFYSVSTSRPAPERTVELGGQTIKITVVETPEERAQGLSGRAGLAPDEGMLFVFPNEGKYAFWMKDMRFSIDIFWLSSDGTIVYMAQNVSPDTYPQNFQSNVIARHVLELAAGFAQAHNVKIGDIVRL